jgi:multicomponent K+:H+ antiporter subunit E
MTRWLPYPRLSIALLIFWLLLNQSVGAGHIALGVVLALVVPLVTTALEIPRARIRRPAAMMRLLGRVVVDVIRSNIAVACIVLRPGPPRHRPGFLAIPLDLQSENGLAALACIITATPGTIWVRFDSVTRILTIHILDLVDEDEWVATIKRRYEALLREIFE